jgi:glutamate--cysteine ligase
MASANDTDTVLEHERQLFTPFEAAMQRKAEKIGLEAEKFGLFADGSPLRYEHVRAMLDELSQRFRWKQYRESDDGPLLALERDGASITLEPGSQLELSGAPFADIHAVAAEVEVHRQEVAQLESARGVRWLGMGFHPSATDADLDWVPKTRYPVMREYLPTRGARGLEMMRRTATVQANYDFSSEADAIKKMQVSLALSPIAQAIFAASPFKERSLTEYTSWRAHVWLDVDPDRTGLLPALWKPDASFGDYVRWALKIPMFVVKRGERFLRATHLTFEQFWRDGLEGERATIADWETHLNTLFPEVRLKRTIEVRSVDCVPAKYGNALPALFAGILYDPASLAAAHAEFTPAGHDAYAEARPHIARHALSAKIAGQPVRDLARRAVAIAREGLERRNIRDANGQTESVYLDAIAGFVADGRSVGQALLEGYALGADNKLDELSRRMAY